MNVARFADPSFEVVGDVDRDELIHRLSGKPCA